MNALIQTGRPPAFQAGLQVMSGGAPVALPRQQKPDASFGN